MSEILEDTEPLQPAGSSGHQEDRSRADPSPWLTVNHPRTYEEEHEWPTLASAIGNKDRTSAWPLEKTENWDLFSYYFASGIGTLRREKRGENEEEIDVEGEEEKEKDEELAIFRMKRRRRLMFLK